MSLNKVMLIGRLGQDPELKHTPSGQGVCNFSIATSESWVDKAGQKQEKTEWHRIVVWGKLAELCQQYLAKGRQAYIEGKLQTRSWDDKDGQKKYTTEVLASTVQFLGSQQDSAQRGQGIQAAGQGASGYGQNNEQAANPAFSLGAQDQFISDDIPF